MYYFNIFSGIVSASENGNNIPDAVKNVEQSIVKVETIVDHPNANEGYEHYGMGTGFFIQKESGEIVVATNFHVVKGQSTYFQTHYNSTASPVTYVLSGASKIYGSAKLMALSPSDDSALLHPNVSQDRLPPPLEIRTEPLTAEDFLYIVGFPEGEFKIREIKLVTHNQDFDQNFFVVPESVSKWGGASGSPIVDQEGKVVFYIDSTSHFSSVLWGYKISLLYPLMERSINSMFW